MRYLALATDYDGTLAHHGGVPDSTMQALERLKASGRRLILVSGRELEDLQEVFPRLDFFDRLVLENGALLVCPADRSEKALCSPPPPEFAERLRAAGVEPLSVGRVIVATWTPHEDTVLRTIREMGLELQVIFNKGAVMVLPSGVNKATGLEAALADLRLHCHNVVGVGDAENDHAFLSACEISVAVANALDSLKATVDLVTTGERGYGVEELVEGILRDDLLHVQPSRHDVALAEGVAVPPAGHTILVVGTSGSGKSTVATGILERLCEKGYQYCILDPEGDYPHLADGVVLGDGRRAPLPAEAVEVLERPEAQNLALNLLGIPLEHRPAFMNDLLPRLQALRLEIGRPHWILVDEAHHLLPAEREGSSTTLPQDLKNVLFVTVRPCSLAASALGSVDRLLAVGDEPEESLREFCDTVGEASPEVGSRGDECDVLLWERGSPSARWVRSIPPTGERKRHLRKYAHGELPEEVSFYFRGPEGKLNLRAQNLMVFLQIADGVDDETWLYHLERGDYAAWMREAIKDPDLAEAVGAVDGDPHESRARVREEIEKRYTAPA